MLILSPDVNSKFSPCLLHTVLKFCSQLCAIVLYIVMVCAAFPVAMLFRLGRKGSLSEEETKFKCIRFIFSLFLPCSPGISPECSWSQTDFCLQLLCPACHPPFKVGKLARQSILFWLSGSILRVLLPILNLEKVWEAQQLHENAYGGRSLENITSKQRSRTQFAKSFCRNDLKAEETRLMPL